MMEANTLFLRLEGPLQAWGDERSKFVIRRTGDFPSKSGVLGMLCAALGVSRPNAAKEWLPRLRTLALAVRVDRPGVRWWDYHTAGAGIGLLTAEGNIKASGSVDVQTLLSRREYLCDASFLVALQGEPSLIAELAAAVRRPRWAPYLGRRSCPPSRPLWELDPAPYDDLLAALKAVPWRRRLKGEKETPDRLTCFLEWRPSRRQPQAPDDALVFYDVPTSFWPPAHEPRFVVRRELTVGKLSDVEVAPEPLQKDPPAPLRRRADYTNSQYQARRAERLARDAGLCVFCKAPATTVQHVTYRRAGGDEDIDDLRALCRLCHDAITMLEYGEGMTIDRINPEDPTWRDRVIRKRQEIIAFRSIASRRRRLTPQEVTPDVPLVPAS